jgi:hypothetical protein
MGRYRKAETKALGVGDTPTQKPGSKGRVSRLLRD